MRVVACIETHFFGCAFIHRGLCLLSRSVCVCVVHTYTYRCMHVSVVAILSIIVSTQSNITNKNGPISTCRTSSEGYFHTHTHTMHFSQYIDQAPLVSCAGVTVRMGLLFHATETVIQFCYFSYVVTFNNFYRVIVGLQGTCSAC